MNTKQFRLQLFVLILALLALSGCAKKQAKLHIFNWADYMDPATVAKFEQQFNCEVVLDTFDSNESMLAKLEAGASGYDLVFPTAYMAQQMWERKMLKPIDPARIPNLKHIDSEFLATKTIDKTMQYSVPYMVGSTGIAYRKDKVENFVASWSMFDRKDIKGRTTLLNDNREAIGAALLFLGYSCNSRSDKELAEAAVVLKRWKANIAKFDAEAYKPGIASGEFFVVQGYSGDILQVQGEQEEVVYVYPKEGFTIGLDNMCIPTGAKNVELAHDFINFMHDPANAAANTEFVMYLCPNSTAYGLLSDAILKNPGIFIPKEAMARAEVMQHLGPDIAKYNKIWDEIKSGQ
ncbi:MAG: spermidine/putrescine ABC transporter substrate-binding protein [Verrucomicrobiota bacterium]|nr:spermidine/putrescine ABC transporter substrate-binding protein [Verrucomicrobiota bacterium]